MFLGQVLHEAFGADPHPAREQALEMILAQVQLIGNLLQAGLFVLVLVQIADGLLDAGVICVHLGELAAFLIHIDKTSNPSQTVRTIPPIIVLFASQPTRILLILTVPGIGLTPIRAAPAFNYPYSPDRPRSD